MSKIKDFTILKLNRVWAEAQTNKGKKCKLRMCDKLRDLGTGEHALLVKDISVRSTYGTEIKFEVIGEFDKKNIITFRHSKFNHDLLYKCRRLGGIWDEKEKAWIFSDLVADEIDELEHLYNDEMINVEIKIGESGYKEYRGPITFLGYPISEETGRYIGAKHKDNISLISGGFDCNWYTYASPGTIIRMKVPRNLYNKEIENLDDGMEVKMI